MSTTPPPPPPPGGSTPPPDDAGYGGYPPPPPDGPQGAPYGNGPAPTNQKALIAMVLGIASIVFAICCSVLGVLLGIGAAVLGHLTKQELVRTPADPGDPKKAQIGFVTGIVGIVIGVILIVANIVFNVGSFVSDLS